jgi:hypothetical protein
MFKYCGSDPGIRVFRVYGHGTWYWDEMMMRVNAVMKVYVMRIMCGGISNGIC